MHQSVMRGRATVQDRLQARFKKCAAPSKRIPITCLRFPCIALDGLRFTQIPATLAYAAGLNRFWITLIIYSGKLETATMIATLYTKVKESTNARSTQNQYQRVHLKKKDVPK